MKAPVAKGKMSRKEHRREELKRRVTWAFSPVSRRKESRKEYKRRKPLLED